MKSLRTFRSKSKISLSKVRSFEKKHLHLGQAKESMADLPKDLAVEVLSRLPMTSLRNVRSTCKTWNNLCKDKSFATYHFGRQAKLAAAKDEFMLVLMMDYKIHLMSVNRRDSFWSLEGTLISLDDSDQIDVCQVFHCNGLLLCISEDNTRLVVWNPYWGESRWIKPTHKFDRLDWYTYALGYDKSSNSHKILSFIDYKVLEFIDTAAPPTPVTCAEYQIYDFNSDSWRVLDVNPECTIEYYDRRLSLKGNTYWFGKDQSTGRDDDYCLLCFDFIRERFGACLPLPPFVVHPKDTLALSSVRDEQLAVLFQQMHTLNMEIWVTTKIEPNTVSWSSKVFLAVNMRPLTNFQFSFTHASFFIDEEKKVAYVFDKGIEGLMNPTHNVAYMVGVDGSFREAVEESPYKYCVPRVCSYVPSLVRLN